MSDTAKGRWYLNRDGVQKGPLDLQRLLAMLANGSLADSDYVWNECLSGWMQVKNVPQLRRSTGTTNGSSLPIADKQDVSRGCFRVRCRCGNALEISPDTGGHNVRCPKCGESLFVEIRTLPLSPRPSRDESARTPKRVGTVEAASAETLSPRENRRSASPTVKQERSPAVSFRRPNHYPKFLSALETLACKVTLANGFCRTAKTGDSGAWLSVAASRWPLILLGIWLSLSALLYALYRAHEESEWEVLAQMQAAQYNVQRSFANLGRYDSPGNLIEAQSALAGLGRTIGESSSIGEAARIHRQRQSILALLALLSALACWRSFGVSKDSIDIGKLIARRRE